MTETLDTWLQQTPNASWSDVVSALQQMGENTVAESVQQQYIGGVTSELMYTCILCTECNQIPALHCRGCGHVYLLKEESGVLALKMGIDL